MRTKRFSRTLKYVVFTILLFSAGVLTTNGFIYFTQLGSEPVQLIAIAIVFCISVTAVVLAILAFIRLQDVLTLHRDRMRPYLKLNIHYNDKHATVQIINIGDGPAILQRIYTRKDLDQTDNSLLVKSNGTFYSSVEEFSLEKGGTCYIQIPTTHAKGQFFYRIAKKLHALSSSDIPAGFVSSFTVIYQDIYRRVYSENLTYELRYAESEYNVIVHGATGLEDNLAPVHEEVFPDPWEGEGSAGKEHVFWEIRSRTRMKGGSA